MEKQSSRSPQQAGIGCDQPRSAGFKFFDINDFPGCGVPTGISKEKTRAHGCRNQKQRR